MPLDEEGAKWSCEPCIRGHRSSKCQHFDRLMMKVPKAGRPLAKCPHPKGTCSCQKTYAFMVRIPKGSTCLCRPLYKVPADTNDPDQPTPASLPPLSSPASTKVQKPGRRQSNIQTTPGNIAKALEAMPENLKLEDEVSNYLANLPSDSGQNENHPIPNNSFPAVQNSNGSANIPSQPEQGPSCCSSKPPPPPVASNGGGSCCNGTSSATLATNPLPNSDQPKTKQPTIWRDRSYLQYSTPHTWHSSMGSTPGSFSQPFRMNDNRIHQLYIDNYTPNVSSMQYSNMMNGLGISQPNIAPFTANPSQNSTYPATTVAGDPCHDCKCGDECQCLGCAAHPFNNTTRQHVQEMGVMMTFDGDEHTPEAIASAYQSPFHGSAATTPMDFYMQQTPSLDRGMHQASFDPYSDPSSTMPSGYSSPLTTGPQINQQLMHPSEYYTLEYPVGIPSACSDITGSCQCGNDCSCVGCLTHSGHNGVPLEAPIPNVSATLPAHTSEQQVSSHGPPATSAGSHTSRIPVLENVSVPCLSPRTLETSMI
ncbi:uncharacterized protein N7459_007265 [Penicillium hispanicum]|uniref:uncharacterized protein n=1 Tax=Penicillium hispanicum TaxID=1080232 RepID=UPI002540F338|nr:uncharacterized protein N7459_007265 [Penicillium hispanicum]KAJ5578301.1 hypothetical protein N7459_007265 [Penicillium hispanicum]